MGEFTTIYLYLKGRSCSKNY